jgi:hypothetical protein
VKLSAKSSLFTQTEGTLACSLSDLRREMRIVGIVGSLRTNSCNSGLLRHSQKILLERHGVQLDLLPQTLMYKLPLFNEDDEKEINSSENMKEFRSFTKGCVSYFLCFCFIAFSPCDKRRRVHRLLCKVFWRCRSSSNRGSLGFAVQIGKTRRNLARMQSFGARFRSVTKR